MRNSLGSPHTVNAIDRMTCLVPEFNLHSLRGRQLRTVHLGCNRLFHPPEVHLAGVYCPPPGTEVPLRLSSQSASLSTSEDHTDREEASQREFGPAVCGKLELGMFSGFGNVRASNRGEKNFLKVRFLFLILFIPFRILHSRLLHLLQ